jgi:heat shock protein HslJ
MKRMTLIIITAFILTLGIGACNSQSSTLPPEDLAGTSWFVKQIGPFEDVDSITAEFQADSRKASGNAGCNDYTVEYTSDGNNIAFSNFVTTRIACINSTVVKMEQEYQLALLAVQSYARTNGGLELYSGDGELLIQYEPASSQ